MSTISSTPSVLVQHQEKARQSLSQQYPHLSREALNHLLARRVAASSFETLNTACIPRDFDETSDFAMVRNMSVPFAMQYPVVSDSATHRQYSHSHARRRPLNGASTFVTTLARDVQPVPVQEYDLDTYISRQGQHNNSAVLNASSQLPSTDTYPMQQSTSAMPNRQWFELANNSSSPTSPMSLTNASTIDGTMSRSTSLGGPFEMLQIHSIRSSHSNTEESSHSECDFASMKSNGFTVSGHPQNDVGFATSFADGELSSFPTYPTQMFATNSMHSQPSLALDFIPEDYESIPMSAHTSCTSSHSNDLSGHQYTHATRARQLVPKHLAHTARTSSMDAANHSAQSSSIRQLQQQIPTVFDVASADGTSSRPVVSIPRASYRRPSKEKQYCQQCNDHPEGFRGDHELTRHMQRQHSENRKYWIAVDKSPDGKYLANCKHCKNGKKYHAYYNLAAHLRRIHFNKTENAGRGRRKPGIPIPEAERKGGKSGGNRPSIEWLKEKGWIMEVDEYVPTGQPEQTDKMEDDDEEPFETMDASFDPIMLSLNSQWQPSYDNLDLLSQTFSINGLDMSLGDGNFVNTYTTGGATSGHDSSFSFSMSQQGAPTATHSQFFMQQ